MRSTLTTGVLEPLSQTKLEVADGTEDIRGRKVHDRNGDEFGKVEDVFIDPAERRVRFISVKSGDFLGVGGKTYLLPVDAISLAGERVTVSQSSERITQGPQVHAGDLAATTGTSDTTYGGTPSSGVDAAPIVLEAYDFYGVNEPFWSPTYERPDWS